MTERKSLADLLSDVPTQLIGLVKAEIASLKSEVLTKVKGIGMGGVLLAVAGVFALYMLGWLFTAGFEAFKLIVDAWLAALLTAAALLVIILVLVLIALPLINKNKDFNNMDAVDSIKDDVNMVRGLGYAGEGVSPTADLPRTGTTLPQTRNGAGK